MAEKIGLPTEHCGLVQISSQLHDVGKIGVSDTVLLKPGKLTNDEFETIKKHSAIGNMILGDSDAECLQMAASIALTHHEKFNGTGYPQALSGENIPVEERGKHFDPILVDLFLASMDEILAIKEKFADTKGNQEEKGSS